MKRTYSKPTLDITEVAVESCFMDASSLEVDNTPQDNIMGGANADDFCSIWD